MKVFRRVCRLMVISLITIDEEIRRVDGSAHHQYISYLIYMEAWMAQLLESLSLARDIPGSIPGQGVTTL